MPKGNKVDLTGTSKSTENEDEVKKSNLTVFSAALGNIHFIHR